MVVELVETTYSVTRRLLPSYYFYHKTLEGKNNFEKKLICYAIRRTCLNFILESDPTPIIIYM